MSPSPRLPLCVLAAAAFLGSAASAWAWPWNSNPQPLLEGREDIRADSGSPLAWDQSLRTLWYVNLGSLGFASWTSSGTFRTGGFSLKPDPKAGLLVDSGLHYVFFVDASGRPNWLRRVKGAWTAEPLSQTPVTRLLAVDDLKHTLFAYDSVAQGIRAYSFDKKSKTWSDSLIATGLGEAGDAGVFDATAGVLYSSHRLVDALPVLPPPTCHSVVPPIALATTPGFAQRWLLVATARTGDTWTSRLIDETGVPQQPAVRASDHRVFYAKCDALSAVSFYQPSRSRAPESSGTQTGWSGSPGFEDNDLYPIKKPQYPWQWNGGDSSGSVTMISVGGVGLTYSNIATLTAPVTLVPYYEPQWTKTALPERLTNFRAVINPRQSLLVEQRVSFKGEELREQTGRTLAGYLYKGANGQFAKSLSTASFPRLDANFDPLNLPAAFAQLADPKNSFLSFDVKFSPSASIDGQAPFAPVQLRLPTQTQVQTFGHSYRSDSVDQAGGRYRFYHDAGTGYATASGLAVDRATGVSFYTQAAPPATSEAALPVPELNAPASVFTPAADRKLTPPTSRVWIVMVY